MSKGNFIIKLILILSSVTFILLAVEFSFRIGGIDKRPLFKPSDIPGLAFELVSHSEGRTRGNLVKINSFGLRDYEFSFEKPKNTFRILGLGDSFTYGEGVALEQTYLKILEQMLNKQAGVIKYQVINAACPAYNTVQESIYLREKGMSFKPDLLIIGYVIGDTQEKLLGPPTHAPARGIKGMVLKAMLILRKGSYAYDFLSERIYVFWQKNILHKQVASSDVLHRLHKSSGRYWPKCEEALGDVAWICKQANIRVLLLIWPIMEELNENHPYLDLYQQVAEAGRKYDMEVLELFPLFKGIEEKSLWISPSNSHPNAQAHLLAAEEILNYLISRKLINPKVTDTELKIKK